MLCVDCAVGFFVSFYKYDAGIPAYFKKDLCKITENVQASRTQSRQAVNSRCCLINSITHKKFIPTLANFLHIWYNFLIVCMKKIKVR